MQLGEETTILPVMSTEARNTGRSGERMIQLDFLRGIAVLLVIGDHNSATKLERGLGILRIPATLWNRGGWSGVDLFFVLSGFLIGGLLFAELLARKQLDVGRFMVRRGLKIWPSYYLFLAALVGWTWLYDHHSLSFSLRAIVPNLLHVQNYWSAHSHQTWSLAIEEHFYLILPFTIAGLCRRAGTNRPHGIALLAGAVMAFCLIDRFLVGWNRAYDGKLVYFPTHIRIDSLFFGVLLAYVYHYKHAWIKFASRFRWLLLLGGLLLLLPEFVWPITEKPFVWTFGYTLLYLGYGAILMSLMCRGHENDPWIWFFRTPPARMAAWIGTFSYSIYLWHIFIVFLLNDFTAGTALNHLSPVSRWLLISLLLLSSSILLGVAMGKLVEIPVLAVRDRLFPRRATALDEADPAAE